MKVSSCSSEQSLVLIRTFIDCPSSIVCSTQLNWPRLKNYVRDNNVNFRLSEVRDLAQKWMSALDTTTVTGYLNHVCNIKETFKKSDNFTEIIEEELMDEDDDEEVDSVVKEMAD